MLKDEREAPANRVLLETPLAGRDQPRNTLVWHAAGQSLVEVPLIPAQMDLVRLRVRQQHAGVKLVVAEDEPVDRVAQKQVLAAIGFGQVVRLVSVFVVRVRDHLMARGTKVLFPRIRPRNWGHHRVRFVPVARAKDVAARRRRASGGGGGCGCCCGGHDDK